MDIVPNNQINFKVCFKIYSLLDILAGRRNRKEFSGDVFINGNHQSADFRLASGFVVQVRKGISFPATITAVIAFIEVQC